MNQHQRDFAELMAVLTVVAALLVCTAIAGCATEQPAPIATPIHHQLTCGDLPRDRSYLLTGCKP